jgi:hypothetical protein
MYPDVLAKLDTICSVLGEERGRPVFRTEVINELVARRYSELPRSAAVKDAHDQAVLANGKGRKRKKKRKKKRR